jgi:chaperone BCS1
MSSPASLKKKRDRLRLRTGIDAQWLIAACIAIHSSAHHIPKMMSDLLEQVKSQTTSSITIDNGESALRTGILRYIRTSAAPAMDEEENVTAPSSNAGTSWPSLHGQHDLRDSEGVLQPLPGSLQPFFWYENTLLMLDLATDQPTNEWDRPARYAQPDHMTLRCFGHSNTPIDDFIRYIKEQSETSTILDVHLIGENGRTITESRDKRLMLTIDMELGMRDKITQIVTDFFHPGTRIACKASGAPHRLGFLLSGPPGTGKTSLSVAVASQASVSLALVNLQGMDDHDLAQAFSSLPSHCVVLLEDIDASSADVKERSRRTADPLDQAMSVQDAASENHEVDAIVAARALEHSVVQSLDQMRREQESALRLMRQEQETSNQAVIELVQQHLRNNNSDNGSTRIVAALKPKAKPFKRVTMSGLLNVIDGAASVEGRLLIMTTNHPESLDEALTRPGRCDHHFRIGYATKASAEQTFIRIFGTDPRRLHKQSAIIRFAQAFRDQFPINSKISTAKLAFYCGMYYNRPVDAVNDFSRWLEIGDEIFSYSIKALPAIADKGINVPEDFNRSLLEHGPDDLRPSKDLEQGPKKRVIGTTKRSIFNPLRLVLGGTPKPQKQLEASPEPLLLTAAGEPPTPEAESEHEGPASLFSAFDLKAISAIAEKARQEEWVDSDFEDLSDDEGSQSRLTLTDHIPSLLPPRRVQTPATSEDDSEEVGPGDPLLTASVKFFKEDGLKLVAPHPLSDVVVVPDQPSPTRSDGSSPSSEKTEKHSSNASSRTSVDNSDTSASPTSDTWERDRNGERSGHNDCHSWNDEASMIPDTAAAHAQPETDSTDTTNAAVDATSNTNSMVPSVPSTADSSDDDNEVFFDALK